MSKSKRPEGARAPSASSNGRPKARPQQRKPSRDGRRLAARLRRAKKDLAARDETIDRLESRVAELEQRGKRTRQRPKTGSSARSHVRTSGSPDLNQVTFEELRTLGLSVTQSARLVAARDMRDGFDSLDELDKLTGFPKEQVVELKELFSKATSRSR